jgi:uncharacterized DUF497 family protein
MIRFEWDDENAERHRRKHRISFEIARQVFYDPDSITEEDVRDFDYGEKRYWTLGMVKGRYLLLYVAHTIEDDEEVIRIISARKAEPHERRLYDNRKFS